MAYKRVDTVGEGELDGFSYVNQDGREEYVTLTCASAVVISSGMDETGIYYADIPNLILALQAAYDYNLKENS